MKDSLERLLEETLEERVKHVTWEGLNRPHPPVPAPRAAPRRALPLLVAGVAGAIVLGIGLLAESPVGDDRSPGQVAAGGGSEIARDQSAHMRRFVGPRWAVVAVTEAGVTRRVPADIGAVVQWDEDGSMRADDGTNHHTARWQDRPGGFVAVGAGGTFVGYAGQDPARLALFAAVSALLGVDRPDGATSQVIAQGRDRIVVVTPDPTRTLVLELRR